MAIKTKKAVSKPLDTKRGDLLKIDPRNIEVEEHFNRRMDYGDMETLENQIRENGVLSPIKVRKKKDSDKFILVQGHRRHRACMKLIAEGIELRMPAFAEEKGTSEVDRFVDMIVANDGKPLTMIEVGQVVMHLIRLGLEEKEIAQRLGVTQAHVNSLKRLSNAPITVKEHIQAGKISATLVLQVVRENKDDVQAFKIIKESIENVKLNGGTKITKKDIQKQTNKFNSKSLLKKFLLKGGNRKFRTKMFTMDEFIAFERNVEFGNLSMEDIEKFHLEPVVELVVAPN
jgi:ParB/RepB/Spo0J family partition protein